MILLEWTPQEGVLELQIMLEKPYLIIIIQVFVVILKIFLDTLFLPKAYFERRVNEAKMLPDR